MTIGKYPELDKIQEVKEKSQELGEFLEWLTRKYVLANWVDGVDDMGFETSLLFRNSDNTEKILADYFGIDLVKAEKEREQLLENFRNQIKDDDNE